jgi:quercetin dioxygenase-like cupin family protein
MVETSSGKPYKDTMLADSFIREFDVTQDSTQYVWHRDHFDRMILVIEGTGWQFQKDNELPKDLKAGDIIRVKQGEYHRIIKGQDNLILRIFE